jgi:serine protease AprX
MRRTALVGSFLLLSGLLASAATASGASPAARSIPMDRAVRTATGDVSVLIHTRAGHLADGVAAARRSGLAVGSVYESIEVFVAFGPASVIRDVAGSGHLSFVESNHALSYFTETSHQATRGQRVLDEQVTLPGGTRIDGTGIGIAIVDSGLDGTHPDLADHVGGNVKTVCSAPQFVATGQTGFTTCLGPKAYVPVQDSDTISAGGHGTHVGGIVAGDGSASAGRFHGAAPEATLYGVSVGTTMTVENGLDGLEWVLDNHGLVTPEIKVVNNSWGGGHAEYDPQNDPFSSALWKLQEDLVRDGVTVVFAAGNAGGNGNGPTTAAECINPTPGVICVANYDDKNTGTRDGTISPTSSRGEKGLPESYPDIAAPGTSIVSTCRATLPICWAGGGRMPSDNLYANMSGTSMAAPHVTGIIAQMYQVDPTLTPARVENVLEDTAWKSFGTGQYEADPFNGNSTTSYDRGHGLVDALAAIQAL